MKNFNQPPNFGISVTRGEYFISWIFTLANALYGIFIRAKLFCHHSEIIKKLTSNIKFGTDLFQNTIRQVSHSRIPLVKGWLYHHFGNLRTHFWIWNNCDMKETNTTPFSSFLDSVWSPISTKNRRADEFHASHETRRTHNAREACEFRVSRDFGDYSFFENFSTKEDWMNFTTHSALWSAGNLYVSLDTFLLV